MSIILPVIIILVVYCLVNWWHFFRNIKEDKLFGVIFSDGIYKQRLKLCGRNFIKWTVICWVIAYFLSFKSITSFGVYSCLELSLLGGSAKDIILFSPTFYFLHYNRNFISYDVTQYMDVKRYTIFYYGMRGMSMTCSKTLFNC